MSVTEISSWSSPADVADSVTRVRETYASGRTRALSWRVAQLEGVLRFLDECEDDINEAIATDLGRGDMATFMADIAPVRHEIRHTLSELAGWMKPTPVTLSAATAPGKAWTQPEPKGVALIIGAWNFPLLLTIHPLVSALAAGNTAVIKPSELAEASARLIAEKLPRYVDSDALQVVCGGIQVATELLSLRFDHIFFTGSTTVGRKIMLAAAEHLTPVTLELGGKSPVIVAADADIEVAARRIAWAKSVNAGQACIAPDYVLVEESVRPRLVERLLEELPERGSHDSVRIINRRHLERIKELLTTHRGEQYGGIIDETALTISPALVTDPDPDSQLMSEEIFGPVLPVLSVPSIAAAIEFINARPRPLALYVFTSSRATEDAVLQQTSSGSVGVNHLLYQLLVPELPFGGVGQSGMGAYHGRNGFETFSHRKAVLRKPTSPDLPITYPPYGRTMRRIMRRFMG